MLRGDQAESGRPRQLRARRSSDGMRAPRRGAKGRRAPEPGRDARVGAGARNRRVVQRLGAASCRGGHWRRRRAATRVQRHARARVHAPLTRCAPRPISVEVVRPARPEAHVANPRPVAEVCVGGVVVARQRGVDGVGVGERGGRGAAAVVAVWVANLRVARHGGILTVASSGAVVDAGGRAAPPRAADLQEPARPLRHLAHEALPEAPGGVGRAHEEQECRPDQGA
ncbi:MAG: hypothetical protein J3K34DRAFT_404825 [Monoraphidium minutum]|nr:MAG: hypothetical protein J3K34DRAFT_404825 [Monoraphidium minutum]